MAGIRASEGCRWLRLRYSLDLRWRQTAPAAPTPLRRGSAGDRDGGGVDSVVRGECAAPALDHAQHDDAGVPQEQLHLQQPDLRPGRVEEPGERVFVPPLVAGVDGGGLVHASRRLQGLQALAPVTVSCACL